MKWQDVRRDLPLASDRGSDPTLLDRLSSHPDWEVRGAVAKNPTTRPQTLHKLALKYNTDNLIGISVAENPSTEPRTLKVLGLRHPWPWSKGIFKNGDGIKSPKISINKSNSLS